MAIPKLETDKLTAKIKEDFDVRFNDEVKNIFSNLGRVAAEEERPIFFFILRASGNPLQITEHVLVQ